MTRPSEAREPGGGCGGLILAAGRSTRMAGGLKLLEKYGETTVVRRVVLTALASGLDPVVVVVGHEEARTRVAVRGLSVRFASVEGGREGRLVSALAGIAALEACEIEHAVILLGDEPGLVIGHVRAMREAAGAEPGVAMRAQYRDRPGHPVVLPAAVFESIPDLAREQPAGASLWDIVVGSGLPHRSVPIEELGPIDIDTRADLEMARERHRRL